MSGRFFAPYISTPKCQQLPAAVLFNHFSRRLHFNLISTQWLCLGRVFRSAYKVLAFTLSIFLLVVHLERPNHKSYTESFISLFFSKFLAKRFENDQSFGIQKLNWEDFNLDEHHISAYTGFT